MSFSPEMILAPTIHRAKQLEKSSGNPLAQSLTLENFIKAVYGRYGTKQLIGELEAKYILASLLPQVPRMHFDYLNAQSEALQEITRFFIDLKCNEKTVKDFSFTQQKEEELEALFSLYSKFLNENTLVDKADVELEVLSILEQDPQSTKAFGRLRVDNFEVNGVHFESSLVQKKILELLRKESKPTLPLNEDPKVSPKFFQAFPAAFHQVDEVSAALKITRTLLEEGAKAEEIIIVSTSIDEYAPILESQLEAFGLKAYHSKGTPLNHFLPLLKKSKNLKNPLHIQAFTKLQVLKASSKELEIKLKRLGLDCEYKELLEHALENTYIKAKDYEGVLLTEPNQLLSLNAVKHIIFMGTDMSQLPPKAGESFLVSQKQKQEFLHGNSIYLSSQNHYLHMKGIAENIYIVTASYKGKTKLARSLMITEKCEDFDISKYQAKHELLRENKRVENELIKPYLKALNSKEMSVYDGLEVGSFKVSSLSASQLNAYATCPRKYFMNKILGLRAPQEDQEGFDAMQKGTIMHRCFELFATEVKAEKIKLDALVSDALQKQMQDIAIQAYQEFLAGGERDEAIIENINHQLFLQELQQGLDNSSEAQGPLQNFLTYVSENRNMLDYFKSSEFEMEFKMDANYNPIHDETKPFIRGFIDRIDILEDEIRIVDYKSKKMDSKIDKKKLEQMRELQDMQLALYILFARRQYGDKKIESYLQTFKSKYGSSEFAKAATYEVGKEGEYVHYDDGFEQSLIQKIATIKNSIENGDFHYDDSDVDQCGWCEFQLMCNIK